MTNFWEYLKAAATYWERKRLLFNGVLALLAAVCWGPDIVSGGPSDWLGGGIVLLFFAVIANVLYLLAYPVDLALQISPLKTALTGARQLLFMCGLILASALALWVMLGTGMA